MFDRKDVYKQVRKGSIMVLLYGMCSLPVLASTDLDARLKQADAFRLQGDSTKTVVEVSQFKDNNLKKQNLYEVYAKNGKGSLVLFQGNAEAGQKLLMLGDKFWMFLPKSRRPIRITPMQKLLGDASAGDISTLSWSDSYSIEMKNEDTIYEDKPALEVTLSSTSKGATYEKIELVLDSQDNFPLKADLYLKSGKLAKTATFKRGTREGRNVVASMSLSDSIQNNQETIIEYKSSMSFEIKDKVFNPSYLVKNNFTAL